MQFIGYETTPLKQFFSKIEKDVVTGCWIWRGISNRNYPQMSVTCYNGLMTCVMIVMAHRWSCAFFNGEFPNNYQVNHKCRNTMCVNWEHLEALSQDDHTEIDRDLAISGGRKGGQTKKIKANRTLPEGVYLTKNGKISTVVYYPGIGNKHLKVLPNTPENIQLLHSLYLKKKFEVQNRGISV